MTKKGIGNKKAKGYNIMGINNPPAGGEERNTRKLAKVGNGTSYSITLPIDAVRAFGWKEKQKLAIEVDKGKKRIIIKDWEG